MLTMSTLVQLCLRWEERQSKLRAPKTRIDPTQYEVAPLERKVAKAFVKQHHYSGSFPADRARLGLFTHGRLVGAAIFAQPARGNTPVLSRFVLLDEVPGNGESWFLARCFEHLAPDTDYALVDSFSDPTPRTTAEGRTVMPGHVGTIYQACNAVLVGRSKPSTLRLLPDGTALTGRSLSKIRNGEEGWQAATAPLVKHGAAPLEQAELGASWLTTWLPRVTRALRHPGCFKYQFGLTRAMRRALPKSLPYPKKDLLAA
jgi:hypothetical protein